MEWHKREGLESAQLVACESDPSKARVVQLEDGMVIQAYNESFEFEDGIMYKVTKEQRFNREFGTFVNRFLRTGESYDMEEFNKYVKERRDSETN